MNRKLLSLADVLIILGVLFLALTIFFSFFLSNKGNRVVVTIENETVAELDLNVDSKRTFSTEYGFNNLVIEKGSCKVETADCRDGICINRGKISKTGESIVCLPHKLIVEIK